ncbi:MAG: ABC transporter permease [Planctomycetota bacterium]|nr:ABC transporter permease [Planctomycetota bacterium]
MARDPFRAWKLALWIYAGTFFFVLYAPLVMIAVLSFNDSEITGFPISVFSLRWYRVVFANPVLLTAFGHSIAVGIAAALIATALALGLALAFRHDFRGKGVLLNLVLVPMVIPGIIGGIVLLIFFGYAEIRSSLMTTVLVAHVNWVLPFAFLTLYPRVHRFDRALEEAAMDLGAHPRQIFLRIVLPIIRPGIIATALFSFSLSFDEFIRTMFVVGEERTVPVQFWTMIVDRLAPELPAMAVVIILVSMAAALLGFTYAKRADGVGQ